MSQASSGPLIYDLPTNYELRGGAAHMPGSVVHVPHYRRPHPKTAATNARSGADDQPSIRIDSVVSREPVTAKPSAYFQAKPLIEFIGTAILMIVAIPIMAVVAGFILVLQGRPVFYRQTRVGKHGILFRIWKFRSMRNHAEQQTGAVWSGDNDPRVTAIGKWLRCSHIDELPQLLNILAGDMSLIGPRPERPEFVCELSRELPAYMERLRVRPGITGLAQLGLGYDHSISDVEHKIELDIKYINEASLRGDCRLFLQTFPYIAQMLWNRWSADHQTTKAVPSHSLTSSKALCSHSDAEPLNAASDKTTRSLAG
ncbi:Sugar transferase involved in LPS biosynthesis (colanic, teichoic acid) [Neorhodopirellula lusitana]|uniref:Sugar transferase involved in LPS biosynthesis (Colanic, teichoic acid) n=1 Tax=Neorhodopirellula lusitana TaxID=445327 RepID=A0ABY1PVC7_9BACT|nr:sugar transferase [Neorhodopirellula lusitana]SMP44201.1 Sugar transferase involved in LPS biosynthesis (colanic, teichoic acid) [Neorhodopirellula lusitana]